MQQRGQEFLSVTGTTGMRLVLFCTPWSTPCKQQWENLDNLSNQYGNKIEITRINLDRSPEVADRWAIHSIPTTLLLSGAREIDRFIGLLSTDRLQALIESQRK